MKSLSAGVVALLQVKDGAVVNTGLVQVGEKTGSQGAVLVRGRRSDAVASTLVASHGMVVGGEGSGEMSVDAGGKVSVSGGNLVMGGPRNSPSAITIGGRDPRSSFGAALTVAGNLILGSQADSTNTVTIREDGVLSCTEATIGSVGPSLSKLLVGTANGTGAPAEFRTTGDLSVGQGSAGVGFVVLSNGGIVTAGGSVVVNIVGIISGNGTLAVPVSRRIVNGGRIQPGLSPGLLTFNGDFEQSATGVLEMQITGTTPGTAHDQLIVNGNASLGGKLVLKFAGGFGPRQGDQFKLLEIAGAMTGDFTEVAVEGLKAGFQYTAESNGIGQIVVTALTDGVPLPARGIFRGVLQGDPPGHETSGFFTIQVTARGRFTARFVFGGRSFATSGKFDAMGKVAKTIPRKGRSALTINLELDKGDTVPVIKGTILDGTQSVIFSAERENAFTGKNPAPQAGKYTMLLPSDPAVSDAPKASGIGTVVIDKLGAIRFAGRLADGKLLSQGTVLSTTGKWPLYVLLYNKRGALFGELNFRDRTESDFDGPLQWARPERPADKYLTAGFFTTLPAIGSKYVGVPSRPAILDLPNGATATLSDADLNPALTKSLALISRNKFVVLDPGADKFSLSATKASGLLSARFTHPKTGRSTEVHGVVFQKQNFGSGFFLRPGTIGSFEIQALP